MLASDAPTNAYEYSVSELAGALKRTIEEAYGRVRVRGELGRVTVARSGHCYLDVKDDKAVINSIIWKGVMNRLPVRPEEGMEVIIEGKLSTYPGRSNYQLIVESLELAGAGALMALLDKRKRALAAEGLFEDSRKVALPFLPRHVGVVTSPTGAVIRDILHRITDRFPVRVTVWPTVVQGERAAPKIAQAIRGFNALDERPDVLIVARGGGSMEDLWCFNDEAVVRAAADSTIPLISAVGHETDWTLIDYASDYRAPTPTGAAEVAVPIRDDLLYGVNDFAIRLRRALRRVAMDKHARIAAARLMRPDQLLSGPTQRLDGAAAKLPPLAQLLDPKRVALGRLRLPALREIVAVPERRLALARLPGPALGLRVAMTRLARADRLRPDQVRGRVERARGRVDALTRRLHVPMREGLARDRARLARAADLLEAYSYQGALDRGYALVTDADGAIIRSKDAVDSGDAVTLQFGDGKRRATIEGLRAPKARKRKIDARPTGQRDLF